MRSCQHVLYEARSPLTGQTTSYLPCTTIVGMWRLQLYEAINHQRLWKDDPHLVNLLLF